MWLAQKDSIDRWKRFHLSRQTKSFPSIDGISADKIRARRYYSSSRPSCCESCKGFRARAGAQEYDPCGHAPRYSHDVRDGHKTCDAVDAEGSKESNPQPPAYACTAGCSLDLKCTVEHHGPRVLVTLVPGKTRYVAIESAAAKNPQTSKSVFIENGPRDMLDAVV